MAKKKVYIIGNTDKDADWLKTIGDYQKKDLAASDFAKKVHDEAMKAEGENNEETE